jgi:hypothetical protein
MKYKLSIIPLLLILTACAALSVPPADTFNKRAAAATATVNTVSQTALTLLQARKITPDESDRYIARAEEAQKAINVARSIYADDPMDDGQHRLVMAIRALEVLTAELEARK